MVLTFRATIGVVSITCGRENVGGRQKMRQAKYLLSSPESRILVRDAIVDVCRFRCWILYALHVRTNHVHGIVDAEASPSRIFNDWKAYSTRSLRDAGVSAPDRLH